MTHPESRVRGRALGPWRPPGLAGARRGHQHGRPPILHPSSRAPQNRRVGWRQPRWQGPPGWPGSAKSLTHGAHVPARGKAIGGERGRRSPKYPGAPDTGDYRFAGGTVAWPGSPWLPVKHQNPPKPLPSPFPLLPRANDPTVMGGCRVPAAPAGPLVPFPADFSPKYVGVFFSQPVQAKRVA